MYNQKNVSKEKPQLLHLWTQTSLQDLMIEFFERNFTLMVVFQDFLESGLFEDLLIRIRDKHENDVHNILLYWTKFFLILHSDSSINIKIYQRMLSSLYNEIKTFVTEPSAEKDELISMCEQYNPPNGLPIHQYIFFLHQGLFEKVLEYVKHNDYLATCLSYKELGMYDEALEIFLSDPDGGNNTTINKVLIACCFILKGESEKGINVLNSISDQLGDDDLIQIGRAFYDVGFYDKSREYFDLFISSSKKKTLSKESIFEPPGHFILDGCIKILLLKDDRQTLYFMAQLAKSLCKYEDKDLQFTNGQLRFRCMVLHTSVLIQNNEVFQAFKNVQSIITHHKGKIFLQDEICFREVFFISSQWKAQGCFYKALSAYRIIEMYRSELNDVPELFLHDYNNVDVTKEIELCSKNLIRIFKISAKQ